MLFKLRDRSSIANFSKYDITPYNIEILDYCDVISSDLQLDTVLWMSQVVLWHGDISYPRQK